MATKTNNPSELDIMNPAAMLQTERDLKDAVLMVSVSLNLFMVSLWVAVQVTTVYDSALATFFFGR